MLYHQRKPTGVRLFDPVEVAEMIRLRRSGLAVQAIGYQMGIPPTTVDGFLRRQSVDGPNPKDDEFRRLVAAGLSRSQIKVRMNLSENAYQYRRRMTGVGPLAAKKDRAKLRPEHIETVRFLAGQGHTQEEIGKLFGISQNKVCLFMAEHKIEPCARNLPPVRQWVDLDEV